MNKKIIVRKSKDSDVYIAFGYIKMANKKWGMVWFEGKSFIEALSKAWSY